MQRKKGSIECGNMEVPGLPDQRNFGRVARTEISLLLLKVKGGEDVGIVTTSLRPLAMKGGGSNVQKGKQSRGWVWGFV